MKDSDVNNGEIIGALVAGGATLVAVIVLGNGFTLPGGKAVLLATIAGGLIGRVIWKWLHPSKASKPVIDDACKG